MKSIKTLFSKVKKIRNELYVFLFTLTVSLPASAATPGTDTGLIKILKNVMELAKVSGQTIIIGAYAGGLASIAYAFWLFRTAGDPNGQNKGVYAQILLFGVAGAGLLYVGVMATLAGQTLLGTDAKTSTGINGSDFGL